MTSTSPARTQDRVEALISAVDMYEPHLIGRNEDMFRVFARFVSRSIDARYLERHPPAELLPDLEHLFHAVMVRKASDIRVRLNITDAGDRRGVLTTCMPDIQFTYSTVRLALDQLGVNTFRSIPTVLPLRRKEHGEIEAVGVADAPRESIAWIEVEADNLAARREEIENHIAGRLGALQVAIADFQAMRGVIDKLASRFEALAPERVEYRARLEEDARMLRWLLDEHYVILGVRYLPEGGGKAPLDAPERLGIAKFDDWRGTQIEEADRKPLTPACPFLSIRKSKNGSWVYRAGRTTHIVVQAFDEKGKNAGCYLIEGLLSFQGLATPRTEIPRLDRMLEELFKLVGANRGSHLYRTVRNAFNSLPLEFLFSLSVTDVRLLVEQILDADAERRLQVHITTDREQHTAFVFVALPRSHYNDELRADIRKHLKTRFKAASIDDGVYAGDGDTITFHFFLVGVVPLDQGQETELAAEVEAMASPWADRLYDELRKRLGVREARRLHTLYANAFSGRYQEETSIARAVSDIELVEQIGPGNPFDCDIYREKVDETLNISRLRLFENQTLYLSNILPILDNFGLIVIDQFPTTVKVPGRAEQVISTFRIRPSADPQQDLLTRKNRLRSAVRAVVSGAMDNDPLNRLLLRADIPWSYVALVRAYSHYARQIGNTHGDATTRDILLRHADVVKALTEFFRTKFDPDFEGLSPAVDAKRVEVMERSRRQIEVLLEGVTDLTADQVLRAYYNLIDATVRTNFYARDEWKQHHVVLKFQPEKITRMPDPRPYREICVYHPLISGLHLRGGPIARGGIRWSDRRLDYRTEVLGLMATQNLKNVLIVPRGAKGAFVLKDPPEAPAERRKMADEMYKIFIGGLLDVTDNLVNGEKVTPPRVLCYDDKDHYLVVAADKGTAHLSDTANAIALERGFWLGDAFASGGSKGYDHKKEGITAKGAWECVKRHFREMGLDPEVDRIRVVGVGDMSGDVFGNGMILSRSMQLLAAFDHRHIFIDPNPDPAKSFEARKALFDRGVGTSWEDYPAALISKGGGVFPRRAKSVKLSPEARAAFGISAESLSGPELVQAVLRAPVDLLWNGGIGTYIKATSETHLDVGDATNDSVRIDSSEVRARVVSEGGNLGITQEGRIELAARGVRLNTDALDNSAGVDLSDHEVNLKILFEGLVQQKRMTRDERDAMMEQVRLEVDRAVLENNWVQSRMVSLDELRSKQNLGRFVRTVQFLSDRVPFKRRDMHLPGERIFTQRMQRGEGMFRPELAILCANAKQDLRQELVKAAETVTLDKIIENLLAYFPPLVIEKLEKDVRRHPLGINIARTILCNRVLGDAGTAWLAETTLRTGRTTGEILDGYARASVLLDAAGLKRDIGALETKVKADFEYRLRLGVEDALERTCNWLLRRDAALADKLAKDLRAALASPKDLFGEDDAGAATLRAELEAAGAPAALAARVAVLPQLDAALDAAWVAALSGKSLNDAGHAYTSLGATTGLLALTRTPPSVVGGEEMDSPAHFALRDRLRKYLVELAAAVLRRDGSARAPSERTTQVVEALRRELAPLAAGPAGLSALVMATDRIERNLDALRGS